ncbi:MAG: SDR family NAD(P)-dependent oxidoreductase [Rickettsiales bacterium]
MKAKPTTLITGAAKRIGASIARHLAGQGHDLVLHYNRSATEAKALAAELSHVNVTLVQADLSTTNFPVEFWKGLPPVTTIIHNASHYTRDKLESFTPADLRTHVAVNLEAPLLLTQGFMKQLPGDVKGNVILLGDDALGWSASPEFFSYAVSKHGWRTIIDLLAAACAPRVRANMIALAPTLAGEGDPEGLFDRLAARAPLKRTGDIAEVLAAIDYLLTACGLTGQTLGLGNGIAIATKHAELQ